MHINHILRRFRKPSGLGQVLNGTLLSAVMLLQPFNSAWAVDRLSTGQSWFVLNETGIDLLGVQRLRVTGPDADAFAIEGYTGSPAGMLPSQDMFTPALMQKTPSTPLGVNLRFTPQHSGNHQASLEVTHDGSNASPSIYPLTGAGDWDVAAQTSSSTLDFGERAMGMPAVTKDAFVRAVGTHGWLTVTGMKLEGSPDFSLAQAGLANKGSATWGTGANLEVLPGNATELSKSFIGSDVSAGGLTDAATRVRYTPTLRGLQSATLTVYHDGPSGQSVVSVMADGTRGTSIELRGNSPYASTAVGIIDFPRIGLNSAAQSKTVYLRASGVAGSVTYTGFKVEGASDFQVTAVGLVYSSQYGDCSNPSYNQASYSGPISYSSGSRGDVFSLKGTSVAVTGVQCGTLPGKDFGLTIKYTPNTRGKQTATITVYHDGNDEGYTTFDISGEAFMDTSVELRGNSPYDSVSKGVTNFSRTKVNSAAQSKIVYLKASGTYGNVTYGGFKVEGSSDFTVITAGRVYSSQFGDCSNPSYNQASYSGPIVYPAPGSREASFSLKGTSVVVSGTQCRAQPGKDFGLTLQYTPRTLGKQTATITIYHDGNAQGFTTFDISGEAY